MERQNLPARGLGERSGDLASAAGSKKIGQSCIVTFLFKLK
jgi:hypothetical protein